MKRALLLPLCMALACEDPLLEPSVDTDEGDGSSGEQTPLLPGWPTGGPCELEPESPSHLLLTTTDFATGAVTLVDLSTGQVSPDVALSTPDAIPFGRAGRTGIVHRFGYDFVELLTPGPWTSQGQHALATPTAQAPNPQSIAFDEQGMGYVTLFGSPELLVLDLQQPPGSSTVGSIDLSAFADDDGIPEAGPMTRCGDTLWVAVQRLDVPGGFVPRGPDAVVAVDLASQTPYDLDPDQPGAQGLPLQGTWLKQLRLDPADPSRQTLLALTSGLERIDVATGDVTWAVSEQAFADAGVSYYQLPLGFAVGAAGRWAYIAAYAAPDTVDCAEDRGPCFERAQLFEVDLAADEPTLVPFHDGLQAVERTVERAGDTLWVATTQVGAHGLMTFDLTQHPPVRVGELHPTGLPPYSLTSIAP